MKIKKLLSGVLLATFLFPISLFAQNNWAENDDMYFSKKDREKLFASAETFENSLESQSEYTASNNLESSASPQEAGADADNNQYFIKDYSLKNKADNEVKTYSGINTNTGFQSGFNAMSAFGSYGQAGRWTHGYCNPHNDPSSPFFDLSKASYNPWNYNAFRYDLTNYYVYKYNPWNPTSYYGYNGNSNYSNNYIATSYSNNVGKGVKYRNGRKIISGSRNTDRISKLRSSGDISERPVKDSGTSVNTGGRSSSKVSRISYRKYPNSVQNRIADEASSRPKRVNTYSKTNSNSNNTNWSNSSNFNRSNSYRSSGSSSGSRSSSYSRPKISSPSGSGSRSSSGSSSGRGGKRNN